MAIESQIITVAAGTPVQLATSDNPLIVAWFYMEMLAAASGGRGYLMLGVKPGTTPTALTTPTIELAAATSATVPGGVFQLGWNRYLDLDLSRAWVDGGHTGDKIVVYYETKSR